MLVKTTELTGAALDWAVAKANEGWDLDGPYSEVPVYPAFSLDWSYAGPIIELEHINISNSLTAHWMAFIYDGLDMLYMIDGQTPLIAAMRCYVASKLGDDVEIPSELT